MMKEDAASISSPVEVMEVGRPLPCIAITKTHSSMDVTPQACTQTCHRRKEQSQYALHSRHLARTTLLSRRFYSGHEAPSEIKAEWPLSIKLATFGTSSSI